MIVKENYNQNCTGDKIQDSLISALISLESTADQKTKRRAPVTALEIQLTVFTSWINGEVSKQMADEILFLPSFLWRLGT